MLSLLNGVARIKIKKNMGMLQTNLKIIKEGRDINHAVSHYYGMIQSQLKDEDYDKLNVFAVNEDNFDEVMERQENCAQDNDTRHALHNKMKQRRLVCIEVDW